ncbi:MAG: TssN family type VI secretion system protein [Chitinophagaceae bacterium]
MAIQVFLGYFGALLGCSIIFAVLVKNLAQGIAAGGKKPFISGSFSAILTSLVAYLASYYFANPFELFWVFGGIFLLLGFVYILLMHKRFFYTHKNSGNKVLLAELLFGLSIVFFTIVVFSALQYFTKDKGFLFYPIMMSAILFFVPLLILQSFQAAYDIPAASFPTWQYPLGKTEELPDIHDSDRVLIIGFEVAERETDARKIYFRLRAPETWQLGTLFYRFINEYNDAETKTRIEYIDRDDNVYEWWFYRKPKWYELRKILHPGFSIRESGITENTVIVCERLLKNPTSIKQIQ